MIVRPAVCDNPVLSARPPMMIPVVVVTVAVLTVNGALIAPAGTVMLMGTIATALFEVPNSTTTPPACAGLASVAVPVDDAPPVTVAGFRVIEESGIFDTVVDGFTVNTLLAVADPNEAVIVAEPAVDVEGVVNEKLALIEPWATVTFGGIVTNAGLFADNVTSTETVGAVDRLTRPTPD